MSDLHDPEYAEQLEAEEPESYLRRRDFLQRTAITAGLASGAGLLLPSETLVAEAARRQRRQALPSPRNLPIDTFVVLMMENRSYDHYLGWYEKGDGRQAGLSYVGRDGKRETTRRFAPDFQGCGYEDPTHSWNGGREEVNRGRMDGFLRAADNDVFAISYYTEPDLPFLPAAAKGFTLYDRFFCSVLGPTYPNREYMHAGESYGQKRNNFPNQAGYPSGFPDNTIFAALARRGISNRYFFNDLPVAALWGEPGVARSSRVEEYYSRAATGTLPAVSFVDPAFAGADQGVSGDEHPHGDIRTGQAFMSDVVHAFMESPQWRRGALFIVYDEWGGFFDHVPPPRVPDGRANRNPDEDFGQMGIRIPAVAVSPYVRRGHVDHGVYGFESILKMICYRFGLAPLNKRVRYARNIARSFDFASDPRLQPPRLPDPPTIAGQPCGSHSAAAAGAEPAEHDFARMRDNGWLERFGFEYRPATAASTFREPTKVEAALKASS